MNTVKTIVTGLVTGAVASAATALIIAKVSGGAPPPRCELTGTKMPPAECKLFARQDAAAAELRTKLDEAARRIESLESATRPPGTEPAPPLPPPPPPPTTVAPTRNGRSAKPSGLPFH